MVDPPIVDKISSVKDFTDTVPSSTGASAEGNQQLSIHSLKLENLSTNVEAYCPSADPSISVSAGSCPTTQFYFYHGDPIIDSFLPNTITSPSDCTDQVVWEYLVFPSDSNGNIDYNIATDSDLHVSATRDAQLTIKTGGVDSSHSVGTYYYRI